MTELCNCHNLSYEEILTDMNVSVKVGARIGITGINGAGKSTLLKLLANQIQPTTGHIEWFRKASTFLVEQEKEDFNREIPRGLTSIWQVPEHPYALLSGGEKLKIRLAEAFAEKSQLLLLDEPMNHLDLESRKQLEKVLEEYDGTLIVVSHDAYFVEKITTRKLIIENQRMVTPTVVIETPVEKERMQLETRLQEVLGKLSFLTPKDAPYEVLDEEFNEITKRLQQLR